VFEKTLVADDEIAEFMLAVSDVATAADVSPLAGVL
jgi:hypothetical protein